MSAEQNTISPEVLQRVVWMARSPALLAFGGDSVVELLSAAIVFRRFYAPSQREDVEERAGRMAGSLLFVLAAFVAATSALAVLGYVEAQPSTIGIAVLGLAAMIMPWLAAQKRQLSMRTGSAALRADAAESAVCGYLALICFSWSGRQCRLGSALGRSGCRAGVVAANHSRGMGSMEGQTLLRFETAGFCLRYSIGAQEPESVL